MSGAVTLAQNYSKEMVVKEETIKKKKCDLFLALLASLARRICLLVTKCKLPVRLLQFFPNAAKLKHALAIFIQSPPNH